MASKEQEETFNHGHFFFRSSTVAEERFCRQNQENFRELSEIFFIIVASGPCIQAVIA
jgi:hypothetical protein